ncbi:hypothetical protein AB1484_35170 [Parafrankia sp. FMc6]|uniref:phosphotransferase-like protein n=1 Tax=Parafrankia soli TaxID=2599596 RepID=UPI0034D540E9
MSDLSVASGVEEKRCPAAAPLHSRLRTPDFAADPFTLLGELRDSGPVHRCEPPGTSPIWLITRYTEGSAALTDRRLVKDPTTAGLPAGWQPGEGTSQLWSRDLASNDPPDHTRLRRLVARPFTQRRVESLRPGIEKAARDLRQSMVEHDTFDLITDFAGGLTTATICDLLGIPAEDREIFQTWADTFFTVTVPGQAHNELFIAITKYFARLIARRREDPQDDLLSALIRDTGEDRLDGHELISMASSLLITGIDPPAGRLIILNGASSSGKSTLADALRRALDEPFLHVCSDRFVASGMLPERRDGVAAFAWWERVRPRFFAGFHRCLPALASIVHGAGGAPPCDQRPGFLI